MKIKLAQYLARLKAFNAIADADARAAALKTLEGLVVVDDNDDTKVLEVRIIDDAGVEGGDAATQDAGTADTAVTADVGTTTETAVATQQRAVAVGNAATVTPPVTNTVAETEEQMTARIVRNVIAEQTRTARSVGGRLVIATRGAVAQANAGNTGERFIVPKGIKPGRNLRNFKGVRHGKSAEERAYRFGNWILASLTRQVPGRFSFKSAIDFVEEQKLHREGDNGSGGYLVPEEFGTDLIDLRETYGVARNILFVREMTSDTRTDPRRVSGLTAFPVGEGGCGTGSDMKWDEVRLTAKKWMVLSRYTAELDADAVINIGDELAKEIAYAFSQTEDDCAFNGDGTSAYHGITGCRTKLAAATAGLQIASGNSWSTVTLNDLNGMVGLLPQYADSADAVWVAHRAFYYGVMQRLELAAGGVTSMEVGAGSRRPRPTFLGYPVEISQKMPAATASGQIPVMLGDFKKAATFGDRQQDSIAFSEHATVEGASMFQCNQIAIRGTERFDINVHDVGDTAVAGPIVGLKTQ